ncbi:hypothetical protein BBJ29_009362 [Phytophthora kernoviae]|uniref:SNF2 N-terminal domain-containing protein n=1 Tax=Phytophthora kernoviae TaxID=325452 RepID=A0A421FVY8_9STRA|nr:hypothetical protein BBJ29_009362 [Phytophthora kernoviae]
MPRRKTTPSKRPLDLEAEAHEDALWLQFQLQQTGYATLHTALGALCSNVDYSRQQLRIDATLLVNDQVKLHVHEDTSKSRLQQRDGDTQLPLSKLFPGTYEAWLPHVPVLAELKLLTVHIAAVREQAQDVWAFNMSVGVAWRKYMASCSSRGLVPVLAAPRANPVRPMHHVMIWLLKQMHDAHSEHPDAEAPCTFRYWNEVDVLYSRFVGDNTAACAKFENQTFDMPEIYARIDAIRQLACDTNAYEAIESASTDLLPTLRTYQKAAVSWMLSREESVLQQGPVLPLCVTFSGSSAKNLQAYDPFCAAFHAVPSGAETFRHTQKQLRPVVLDLSAVRGGILADEMGLGKTVEVIALMLSHRRPSLRPQLLSIHNKEDEGGKALRGDVMSCICGSEDDHPMGQPIHAQWEHELSRHVRIGALSVIRYPGVRVLRTRLEGTGPSAEWQVLASPGLVLSR